MTRERLPQPPTTDQSDERSLEVLGDLLVPVLIPAVEGDRAHLGRTVLYDLEQITQDRHSFVTLVEDLQGPVDDRLLTVCGRG